MESPLISLGICTNQTLAISNSVQSLNGTIAASSHTQISSLSSRREYVSTSSIKFYPPDLSTIQILYAIETSTPCPAYS
ncbi:hypothetical protein VNO80_03897 [Phaseolus coccineus]|uniref:Uncharacterized protein n=1 Tax=Phaseolus coccineus TaxID=3886 RepID=A0AAN9RJ99_PHACN